MPLRGFREGGGGGFFAQIKKDLGFGVYVPDGHHGVLGLGGDAAAPMIRFLAQPLLDFYQGYQVREGANETRVTVRSTTT